MRGCLFCMKSGNNIDEGRYHLCCAHGRGEVSSYVMRMAEGRYHLCYAHSRGEVSSMLCAWPRGGIIYVDNTDEGVFHLMNRRKRCMV